MYEVVEPRIEAIRKELERILALIDLEYQGQPLKINGFRLRNLKHWQTGQAQNAYEALGPLSGVCNASCRFCMEKSIPFDRDQSFLSLQEANTRLHFFSPETNKCLFPAARPHMETLLNKDAVQILAMTRQKSPSELLIITTNGSTLTADLVQQLIPLKPLLIKLSINSTKLEFRKSLMGLRKDADVAIKSMALLRRAGIPFVGSIVAWPETGFLEELEQSIREIAAFDPYGVRIRLPLAHKFMDTVPPAEMLRFWQQTQDLVNSIKSKFSVPVWIEPIQYGRVPILPLVDGVIANSPAKQAGIQVGDLIMEIQGKPVHTRWEIRDLFASGALNELESLEVKLDRAGTVHTFNLSNCDYADSLDKGISLDQADHLDQDISLNQAGPYQQDGVLGYPYDPKLLHPGERFGLLFLPDFDLTYLDNILQLICKHQAHKVLLFCSPLTAGTIEQLIEQIPVYRDFFQERVLWIYTLENTWMEGNTQLLDSRFVVDYENALLQFCDQLQDRPDLMLIPDSFGSAWGIDFLGQSVYNLQNRTGIPLELVPWHYIYGRED